MASVLGGATESIENFTASVKVSFNGLSEQQIADKLNEQFAQIANDMAQGALQAFADYTPAFVRDGETYAATLQRLGGSLLAVNTVFDTLNTALMRTSLVGADAASQLIDAFGGGDAFAAQTSAYYQAFYTEQERAETTTRQLTEALSGLGLALPASKDAFRALIEQQDLYTEAGRATYAALVGLAPAFGLVADAATAAAEQARQAAEQAAEQARQAAEQAAEQARQALMGAVDAAFAGVERAVAAQRQWIEAQRDAAASLVQEVSAVFDLLKGSVRELFGEVASSAQFQASQGRAFISQSLAGARAGGGLPDSGALSEAISAARSGLSAQVFKTQADADFERLVLANELKALQEVAGGQLTLAERQLRATENQLLALQQTLDTARLQVDAIKGVDTSVLTVREAVDRLGSALQAAVSQQAGGASSMVSSPLFNSRGEFLNEAGRVANQVNGFTAADVGRIMVLDAAQQGRAFARGGFVSPGLALVGEEGPELVNFKNPGMVYTAAQTQNLVGSGNTQRLESLVAGLTAEVQRLQAIVSDGNTHQRRTADTLDSVTEGGNAMRTEVLA